MSESEKTYPAGMSAERFKELTTPFELTRFGKRIPVPAAYNPEALLKKLQEMQANGQVYDKPTYGMLDMFEPDDYAKLKHDALYPVRIDSTGKYRCLYCGHYKDLTNIDVAPKGVGE